MKHTSKLLTALLLTMAFLVSALPVHGIHAEPETAIVQKKAELVFVIDSTGSMSGAIENVKTRITSFVNSLETQGVNLRIGIVEYRDIEEDGMDSTIIHELNHSPWMNSTSEMVEVLNGISAGGGGDYPETVIDGLGYLVDGETIPWSSDSYKFAVVLTDAGYKVANRHGFSVALGDRYRQLIHLLYLLFPTSRRVVGKLIFPPNPPVFPDASTLPASFCTPAPVPWD